MYNQIVCVKIGLQSMSMVVFIDLKYHYRTDSQTWGPIHRHYLKICLKYCRMIVCEWGPLCPVRYKCMAWAMRVTYFIALSLSRPICLRRDDCRTMTLSRNDFYPKSHVLHYTYVRLIHYERGIVP